MPHFKNVTLLWAKCTGKCSSYKDTKEAIKVVAMRDFIIIFLIWRSLPQNAIIKDIFSFRPYPEFSWGNGF